MGHRLCAEWFTKEASPELFVALCEADDVAPPLDGFARSLRAFDFHDIVLTPPTTLLDGDTVLDLDGVEAHLLYVGPAHTPGDVVVHLPAESIVFTGDILFHRCTPIGWEGTFDNWIAALERIEALDPATVVPGHGPLATVDGLRGQREYLEYVRDEARAGLRGRARPPSRRPGASTSAPTASGPSPSAWPSRSTGPTASSPACRGTRRSTPAGCSARWPRCARPTPRGQLIEPA